MIFAVLGLVALVNPAAAATALGPADPGAHRRLAPGAVVVGAAVALGVLVALAASAEAVLDTLDINVGTYRLGSGVVAVAVGLRWLVAGPATPALWPSTSGGVAGLVAFPTMLTPGAVTFAVSRGAGDELAETVVAAVLALALGAAAIVGRRVEHDGAWVAGVRLLGAVAVVVGVIDAVDGMKTL